MNSIRSQTKAAVWGNKLHVNGAVKINADISSVFHKNPHSQRNGNIHFKWTYLYLGKTFYLNSYESIR